MNSIKHNLKCNETNYYDMATALEICAEFTGEQNESVEKWYKRCLFVANNFNLSESEFRKLLITKLKDKALDYIIYKSKYNQEMSPYDIYANLKSRFSEPRPLLNICKKLLDSNHIASLEELNEILDKSELLYKSKLGYKINIFNLVLNKLPEQVRRAIYISKNDTETWKTFKITVLKQYQNIKEQNMQQNKNKKEVYVSSNIGHAHHKNPFYVNFQHNTNTYKCLIDTGADASIMNINILPKNQPIMKLEHKVTFRSASNNYIRIIGKVIDLKIKINDKAYIISPYITDTFPKHTILGIDFICKYPAILDEVFKNNNKFNTIQNMSISQIHNDADTHYKQKYSDIFTNEIDKYKACNIGTHAINTTDDLPIREFNGRIPHAQAEEVTKEITKLEKLGVIKESESKWCNRLVIVHKQDNSIRLCIDFRTLNKKTPIYKYPIPLISDIYDMLAKSKYFTILDATSGYHQITLDPKDRHKTAFIWQNKKYEYNRMPFGLVNAPSTYQEIMDTIFEKERGKYVISYLDDTIVFSETYEDHKNHVEAVLLKFKSAGLTLNPKKCKFFQNQIKILGNIVQHGKILPDPEKIAAIKNYIQPTTIKELASFLGFANYTRDYIKNFSEISRPLHAYFKGVKKNSTMKIKWNEESTKAFNDLKNTIAKSTGRNQPDFTKQFILITDASDKSIGAVLTQKDETTGAEKIIYTFSKTLDSTQIRYTISEKELLAIIKSLEHFRYYLLGKEFILRCDHQALEKLDTTKNINTRLYRWAMKIQEYKYKFEYTKGEDNIADGLSRQVLSCLIATNIEDENKDAETNEDDILWNTHYKTGHGGQATMYYNLKNTTNIANLSQKISNFIEKCDVCKASTGPVIKTKNRVIESQGENQLWEVDLIGRLTGTDGKTKFILVCIDHFSKYVETKIINQKEGKIISDAIEEQIIKKHGTPSKILSDNGLEFKNKHINALTDKYKFIWSYNAPGNHQTMGTVERANQSLFRKLKKLTGFTNKDWEEKLVEATFAQNVSYHRGLRCSPYVFKFGKFPLLQNCNTTSTQENLTRDKLLANRNQNIDHYNQKYIIKGQKEIKYKYKVGEKVLVYKEGKGDKFATEWMDGFVIKEVLDNGSYIVTKDGKEYKVNERHLKTSFF